MQEKARSAVRNGQVHRIRIPKIKTHPAGVVPAPYYYFIARVAQQPYYFFFVLTQLVWCLSNAEIAFASFWEEKIPGLKRIVQS